MSDFEALALFGRQPVSSDMVLFLSNTTCAIIQVPSAPMPSLKSSLKPCLKTLASPKPLDSFIWGLIKHSNVQTPTLMATVWFLNKLRCILPANAVGMETTRHRIFLASLILSAKALNDSLPLNKHWTKYTDGLLSLEEVNCAERELISLLKWKIVPDKQELASSLHPFLMPIKQSLAVKRGSPPELKLALPSVSSTHLKLNSASVPVPVSAPASRSTSSHSLLSNYSNLSLSNSHSQMSLSSANLSYSLGRHPLMHSHLDYLNTKERILA